MRKSHFIHRLAIILGLLCHLAWHAAAIACNVPVFRFALERWKPDDYQVLLLHSEDLNAKQSNLLADWEAREQRQPSNVLRRLVDLRKTAQSKEQKDADLLADKKQPQITLLYPAALKIDDPLWTAPFGAESIEQLYDSPQRTELVKLLIQGHTAVWLLVESGNTEQDNAAEALLMRELQRLERELKLPELTDAPEDQLLGGPPLAVKFSLLRISRTNDEEVLRQQLLHCEPDIPARQEPLVYPVFGRGRSLLPMIGAGITANNIQEYAEFLVGACSCEIKEQNPGFDLLLAADWDALLKEQGFKPAALSSKDPFPVEPEMVDIPPGSAGRSSGVDTESKQASPQHITAAPRAPLAGADPASHLRWLAGLGMAALLGLGIVFRIMSRRVMSP